MTVHTRNIKISILKMSFGTIFLLLLGNVVSTTYYYKDKQIILIMKKIKEFNIRNIIKQSNTYKMIYNFVCVYILYVDIHIQLSLVVRTSGIPDGITKCF